jgi:hypothetical protein
MANKGGNKDARHDRKSEDTTAQNKRDEGVARDPDIGGVQQRISHDQHMRDRKDRR